MRLSYSYYDMVRTKAEISKVFNENVCHIFTPHRTSLNKSKPRLTETMFSTSLMNKTKTIELTCIKMMMDPLMMRKKLSRLAVTYSMF